MRMERSVSRKISKLTSEPTTLTFASQGKTNEEPQQDLVEALKLFFEAAVVNQRFS